MTHCTDFVHFVMPLCYIVIMENEEFDVELTQNCETVIVGDWGTAKAGDYSIAIAGYRGTAMVGDYGTATADELGTAITGYRGIAIAGYGGTAKADNYSVAIAGYGGTAAAGKRGMIQLKYWCAESKKDKFQMGYIGENGLKPNVKYKLNEKHEFIEAK